MQPFVNYCLLSFGLSGLGNNALAESLNLPVLRSMSSNLIFTLSPTLSTSSTFAIRWCAISLM